MVAVATSAAYSDIIFEAEVAKLAASAAERAESGARGA
jgi:hypothetical protein